MSGVWCPWTHMLNEDLFISDPLLDPPMVPLRCACSEVSRMNPKAVWAHCFQLRSIWDFQPWWLHYIALCFWVSHFLFLSEVINGLKISGASPTRSPLLFYSDTCIYCKTRPQQRVWRFGMMSEYIYFLLSFILYSRLFISPRLLSFCSEVTGNKMGEQKSTLISKPQAALLGELLEERRGN